MNSVPNTLRMYRQNQINTLECLERLIGLGVEPKHAHDAVLKAILSEPLGPEPKEGVVA